MRVLGLVLPALIISLLPQAQAVAAGLEVWRSVFDSARTKSQSFTISFVIIM